ncbi:hypothetical protein [Endozoicomonas numazuensis]|uniref:hypothetical protein n=1 Tax=Endozoicomonas numazuensis TaxID=1137799 RepID=UPI0006906C98|nr:hypothetical protein [Endozoicomonas numazuensis]
MKQLRPKAELGKAIYQTSNIKGELILRTGQMAHEYFEKYLFEANPEILPEAAAQMVALPPSDFDQLAGLEMGGISIATTISLQTGRTNLEKRHLGLSRLSMQNLSL